jgi:quercetin dioxygenase-like cupin family protein
MTAISEPETTDSVWFVEELVRVHLDGERTGGAFGLSEHEGRGGDMTPLHVHQRDDETFYVLDGRLTLFTAGAEPIELGPGEVALAPKGVPHARRIDSERARYLVIGSPAGFEAFLREAGEPAPANALPPAGRPIDPGALAAVAARHGIEILGPPGTLPEARSTGLS